MVVITRGAHFLLHIYYTDLASVSFEHSLCHGSLMATYIYIYIFKSSGYENNEVCPKAHEIRPGKENYWMKTLRTTFERTGNNDQKSDTLAGEPFPLLPDM